MEVEKSQFMVLDCFCPDIDSEYVSCYKEVGTRNADAKLWSTFTKAVKASGFSVRHML